MTSANAVVSEGFFVLLPAGSNGFFPQERSGSLSDHTWMCVCVCFSSIPGG